MEVFLGWSGHKSRLLAQFLKDWIPSVVQVVTPWMSESDIDKGAKWTAEIGAQLELCHFAVICLAGSNQLAPWINFEAGAVSKMGNARVATVCLDLRKSDVLTPLGMFQGTDLSSKEEIQHLIGDINKACLDQALDHERLSTAFDRWWPDLEKKVAELRDLEDADEPVSRPTEDVLDEILTRVRALDKVDGPSWESYIHQGGPAGPACQIVCGTPFFQNLASYNLVNLTIAGNDLSTWQTASLDEICSYFGAAITITGDNGTLYNRDNRPPS